MAQFHTPPGDAWQRLVDKVADLERQLRTLQIPSGVQVGSLNDQVQASLANIDTKVQDSIAVNSYTKAVIDGKDAAAVSTATAASNAFTVAGFTASGGISASDLYARNGPGNIFTGTRVAGWLLSADGKVGTASSSERFKTNIRDAELLQKAEAILSIQLVYYNYQAEVAKRDDPSSPEYVGPEYRVHQELGGIAERLHELGLWEVVIYEREIVTETRFHEVEQTVIGEDGTEETVVVPEPYTVVLGEALRLDDAGQPIPFGIHYEMLGMLAIAASQYLHRLYKAQQDQLDAQAAYMAILAEHVGVNLPPHAGPETTES